MFWHKLRLTALSLLLLAVVATGAGWLTRPPAMGDEPERGHAAARTAIVARADDVAPRGRGPDDGQRPRARPAGQTAAERVGDGLRGPQARWRCRPTWFEWSRGARPGELRWLRPLLA